MYIISYLIDSLKLDFYDKNNLQINCIFASQGFDELLSSPLGELRQVFKYCTKNFA